MNAYWECVKAIAEAHKVTITIVSGRAEIKVQIDVIYHIQRN
jgi:hypothetical protein